MPRLKIISVNLKEIIFKQPFFLREIYLSIYRTTNVVYQIKFPIVECYINKIRTNIKKYIL